MPTQLRDYQQRSIDDVSFAWNHGARSVVLVSPTGCHRAGQLILLKSGDTKPVEDIKVGDLLMGPDSSPRRVLQLIRNKGQMYRINPTHGDPFVINEDHVLTLIHTETQQTIDVALNEWLLWPEHLKATHKLFRVGVTFYNTEALPLFPYFVGVLLGDERMSRTLCFHATKEMLNPIKRQLARFGLGVAEYMAPSYRIEQRNRWKTTGPLIKQIESLGLWGTRCEDKFVPRIYKVAHIQERISLLAGLIDAGGELRGDSQEFTTKSKQLAEDITFIARSVGNPAYLKHTAQGYRVSIFGGDLGCCVPSKRLHGEFRTQRELLQTSFTAEKLGIEPYYGFTLSGDGRYLMGDFTVTHNSGKTRIGVEATLQATKQNQKVLWLAHRRELISQASDRLLQEGIPSHGVILADAKRGDELAPVQVASVDTLRARALRPSADLIIWDEAHHCAAESWRSIHESYPNARHLGMTATPQRGDGAPLGDVFEQLIVGATIKELTNAGHLVPCHVWAPEKRLGSGQLAKTPLDAWQSQTPNKQAVLYAASVAEAQSAAESFQQAGVSAAVIHGATPNEERELILQRFQAGELQILCNCAVLTEGWDMARLEVCIIARGVGHAGLWLQMAGRVLRSFPGKDRAVVLDLAGNVHQHGHPEAERVFSLKRGIELVPTIDRRGLCSVCGGALPCGCARGGVQTEATNEALIPFESIEAKHREDILRRLTANAIRYGYKPGWVWHRFKEHFRAEIPLEIYSQIRRCVERERSNHPAQPKVQSRRSC